LGLLSPDDDRREGLSARGFSDARIVPPRTVREDAAVARQVEGWPQTTVEHDSIVLPFNVVEVTTPSLAQSFDHHIRHIEAHSAG